MRMPTIVHGFDWPDRVVVGTIGEPGSRSFYLQARAGSRIVTVGLEKEQSALLAAKIDEILDELMSRVESPISVPATTPIELVDNDPLEPVEVEFRTGALGLGWDPATAQVVIEAYPIVDADTSETDDDFGPDEITVEPTEMLVVRIPVGTARAFAKRTLEVVGAGRPICAVCGTPIDPDGHVHSLPGDD
jgi:uncharacterized repeat protein (TIGR03847 family)